MMYFIKRRAAIQTAVVLVVAGVGGQALAQSNPLSLTLSETLTFDSNVLRTDANKQRDLSSSTGLGLQYAKLYGRQKYMASLDGSIERYKNNTNFNNESYTMSLSASTSVASNGYLALSHARSDTQQKPQDQFGVRTPISIGATSTTLFGQYGLYGRMSVHSALVLSDVNFDTQQSNNKDSTGVRSGIKYAPSDLLYFQGDFARTRTHYPLRPRVDGNSNPGFGDYVTRYETSLSSGWTVTGYSTLDGTISYTRERHGFDEARDFNGFTGSASWKFTPPGKMSYRLTVDRDTNNAGGFTRFDVPTSNTTFLEASQSVLTTSISFNADWEATNKINLNGGFSYKRMRESFGFADIASEPLRGTNKYITLSLGVSYQPTPKLSLSCSALRYQRGQPVATGGVAYKGETLSCGASYTLN